MARLQRSLTVAVPLALVADYLSDLTNSPEWDAHTVACRRLDGSAVSLGSRYEHTREFSGYEVTLEPTVVAFEPKARITWRGENAHAIGQEDFRFAPDGDGGTVVTHAVEVTLRGVARLGSAMLTSVMTRIADDGTPQLRAALGRLADQAGGR